jgi:hypothetical protein
MFQPASQRPVLRALPLLLAALVAGACGDDPVQGPSQPDPVQITETYPGTLTVNGASVHVFTVDRPGGVTAQVTELSQAGLTFGLSLGSWSGIACQLIVVSAAAREGDLIAGTAQTVGDFCVYINDNGTLTAPADYTVRVTHF